MSTKKRILFVCLGNIVRSPLAENLFRRLAEERGKVEEYEVASAGIGAWHVGESPDPRMRRVAAAHGLYYDGRGKQVRASDLDEYDILIAMDSENAASLQRMARRPEQQQKIHLLREFDPQGGPRFSVPDPYYGGMDGFENVYQIVERSCLGLFEALENDRV